MAWLCSPLSANIRSAEQIFFFQLQKRDPLPFLYTNKMKEIDELTLVFVIFNESHLTVHLSSSGIGLKQGRQFVHIF